MDAKDFLTKFIDKTNSNKVWTNGKKLFEIYRHDAEYTKVVTEIINSIIREEYTPQNEYFRIDAVGWISRYEDMKDEAKEKGLKIKAHLWDLKIAIEHENSKSDWSDEVVKLIHVKCPLKVVISYNYCDERDQIELEKLDFIAKWMKKVKAFNNSSDEEYLIILGNCYNPKTKKDYDKFDYRGYIYNHQSGKFERIGL